MAVDPLNALQHGYDMIWAGMDESAAILLGTELHEKWKRDTAHLELAKSFRVPTSNMTRKKMSEPSISTRFGNFRSSDCKSLRKALEDSGADRKSETVIKWRGQDVHIGFGWYLVEYVEAELATRPSTQGGL